MPVVKTKFFEDALKSILSQTYRDIEIIVVDDSCSDIVKDIIKNNNDSRIRYYKSETRLQVVDNWNKVLSYAKGEYFILFSDDDIADVNYINELYKLSQKYSSVNIFHARVRIIDENNQTKYLATSCPEFETAADFLWHRIKNYRFHYAPDFMVRTKALRNIGGFINFPMALGTDDATWLSLANHGGIAATSKILVSWRESTFNLSTITNAEDKLESVKQHFYWLNNFINKDLILCEGDKEILDEIKKNLNFRISVQQGNAIKAGTKNRYIDLLKVFFVWLRFRKKYSLNLTSLGWAFSLLLKNIRQKP